ncbi:MAG TPA: ABC transporter permease [Gemmatimonadales bacterium]|nr:ABC transporter permease [Gemmatimonadales bacterium]
MREVLALMRVGWLSALSYRLNMVFSLFGLLATFIPVYLVSGALQPVAANSIRSEGGEYFGFLVFGLATITVVSAAVNVIPSVITATISNGTLELLLTTPTRTPWIVLGLASYDLAWAVVRGLILILAGVALGMGTHLAGIPMALLGLLLTLLAYMGAGLGLAAMILAFRTIGPLATGLTAASALLGGAYYSTTVIPSWIQHLAVIFPLTYGLRIMRRSWLQGDYHWAAVGPDLAILIALTLVSLFIGAILFHMALNHARREGTLGQY